MTLQRLVLNERDYILDEVTADRAAAEILAAVRHGGDYVQLESVSETTATVLVTPASAVRFEPIRAIDESAVDADAEGADAWVYYDFDIGR